MSWVILSGLMSCNGRSADNDFVVSTQKSSELAELMRALYDDAEGMKAHIAQGTPVISEVDFHAILTAEATEPDKAASAEYRVFSEAFFLAVENLQSSTSESADSLFLSMVTSCENCHRALCPGPLKKIKKLRD